MPRYHRRATLVGPLLRGLLALLAGAILGCGSPRTAPGAPDQGPDRSIQDGRPLDRPATDRARDMKAHEHPVWPPDGPRPDRAVDGMTTDLGPDAPAPNAIGPLGGTVTSPDGKARLVIPKGALSTTVIFTVTPAKAPPAGFLDAPYEFSPAAQTFALPALVQLNYNQSSVGSAIEASLRIGHAGLSASAFSAIERTVVDQSGNWASALSSELGTFAVLSGGTQASVASVLPAAPAGTTQTLNAQGGVGAILGVPLDSAGLPLTGALVTYSSANPLVLDVDVNLGLLTGKTLTNPAVSETITVQALATAAVKAPASVVVSPALQSTVKVVGSFSVQERTATGLAPVSGATISVVQKPGQTVTTNASGLVTALPPLTAGSLATLRIQGGSSFYDSLYALVAPTVDATAQTGAYRLYRQTLFPAVLCNLSRDTSKAIVFIEAPPKTPADGWTYAVSSPGSLMVYLDAGLSPECEKTQTSASGLAMAFDLPAGHHWVIATKGATQQARLVAVLPGSQVIPVDFQ